MRSALPSRPWKPFAAGAGLKCAPAALSGTYDVVLWTAVELSDVTETRNPTGPGGATTTTASETPRSAQGTFLYLSPTYSRRRCDAATGNTLHALRLKVTGCTGFRGRTTPSSPEACTTAAGCTRCVRSRAAHAGVGARLPVGCVDCATSLLLG